MAEEGLGFKRATAYKLSVKEITESPYIRPEQNPSFLLTKEGLKVYRINLVAVVVEKLTDNTWLLEDGTGRIALRYFDQIPEDLGNGNILMIIGKPREISGEKYLIPEIIKKLDSYSWLKLRNLELSRDSNKAVSYNEHNFEEENSTRYSNLGLGDDVCETIKKLDKGDGVDFSFLIEKLGKNSENVISRLLENGEIFEIRPGKLKVL